MYGRAQLSKFLGQDDGRLSLPTSLVIFTEQSTQIQPSPTRDGTALADRSVPTNLAYAHLAGHREHMARMNAVRCLYKLSMDWRTMKQSNREENSLSG